MSLETGALGEARARRTEGRVRGERRAGPGKVWMGAGPRSWARTRVSAKARSCAFVYVYLVRVCERHECVWVDADLCQCTWAKLMERGTGSRSDHMAA